MTKKVWLFSPYDSSGGNTKMYIIFITLFLVICVLFVFSVLYNNHLTKKFECEKLEGYGYVVKFTENFPQSPQSRCEVKTERGVWIESNDFNIASVEEFVRK